MKIINAAALVLLLLVGTACAVLLFRTSSQAGQISQLRAQVHAAQSGATSEQQQISSLTAQVGSLNTQISDLNVPTDPLSAYDQECAFNINTTAQYPSADTTNSLLWVPCTDNAQTIPQPGN